MFCTFCGAHERKQTNVCPVCGKGAEFLSAWFDQQTSDEQAWERFVASQSERAVWPDDDEERASVVREAA